ncbi:MAG: pyrimidine/purine nucleoside phosphorylase [Proteobacteria bacterium]|nr:pyrimidine/purine nucleoside phosphorylase [Pseudomonadota bacterium]MBU1610668.1 pyrimidine/purine nucleoside phosphorylase [Pseudomonadota bacterium]
MSEFSNVTVTREANIYFEGKVTSRAITFADGSVKTLGIMLPGDYEFGTDKPELMEILAGSMRVFLPGATEWIEVTSGQSFEVPGKASFKLEVAEVTDYCCSYLG